MGLPGSCIYYIVENKTAFILRIFWGLMFDRVGYKVCMLTVGITVTLVIAVVPTLTLIGEQNEF